MQWWIDLSEIVRNFGLVLAAAVGIALAGLRVRAANRQSEASLKQADAALRQAELTRRDHVAERLNRAVDQLQDARLEVRLSAVYTLRQIAADFPDLTDSVHVLLTEYLRALGHSDDPEVSPAVEEINRLLADQLRGRS